MDYLLEYLLSFTVIYCDFAGGRCWWSHGVIEVVFRRRRTEWTDVLKCAVFCTLYSVGSGRGTARVQHRRVLHCCM